MPKVNKPQVQAFVARHVAKSATFYTDEAAVYVGADVAKHRSVSHKRKQYVNGDCHTNGIESFWALLDRGYVGTHHWYSHKHAWRYAQEFAGRVSVRTLSTVDKLRRLATGLIGLIGLKLEYWELAA